MRLLWTRRRGRCTVVITCNVSWFSCRTGTSPAGIRAPRRHVHFRWNAKGRSIDTPSTAPSPSACTTSPSTASPSPSEKYAPPSMSWNRPRVDSLLLCQRSGRSRNRGQPAPRRTGRSGHSDTAGELVSILPRPLRVLLHVLRRLRRPVPHRAKSMHRHR